MERTTEQKVLRVFSILALIFGIFAVIIGVLMLAGGGIALGNLDSIVAGTTVTADQAEMAVVAILVGGILLLVSGVFNLINWRALKKVSNDATKYKTAFVVTIISLIFAVGSLASNFFAVNDGSSSGLAGAVVSVVMNVIILILINKVKNSVNPQ